MNISRNRQLDGTGAIASTFHEILLATLKSNPTWEYPFALGYVSGRFDVCDHRKSDHKLTEIDDYAKGYHKGYDDGTRLPAL